MYSWIDSISFYSGTGLVIVGTVLLNTARSMMTEKGTNAPTNSEDQNLLRRMRLHHFPIDMGIALMTGVVGAAVNTFVAWVPAIGSNGFPFAVRTEIPGCFGPGASIGCVTYDPLGLALDGAFWTGLAFAAVTITDLIRTRLAHGLGKSKGHGSPKSTV